MWFNWILLVEVVYNVLSIIEVGSIGGSGSLVNFVFLDCFELSSELSVTTEGGGGGDEAECLSSRAFSSCFSRLANQFSRLSFSAFSCALSMTYALFAFL